VTATIEEASSDIRSAPQAGVVAAMDDVEWTDMKDNMSIAEQSMSTPETGKNNTRTHGEEFIIFC
jgi:hypothetical protein